MKCIYLYPTLYPLLKLKAAYTGSEVFTCPGIELLGFSKMSVERGVKHKASGPDAASRTVILK